MESDIVHKQLNGLDDAAARRTLVCYLQYLMDYRRDVPTIESHVISELQRLLSTGYVKQLPEDDPAYYILHLAAELEIDEEERNKNVWITLKNRIENLY